jgi:hypothetical protein
MSTVPSSHPSVALSCGMMVASRFVKADNHDRMGAWKTERKAVARAAFPRPNRDLQGMFEFVGAKDTSDGCDDTRRFTQAWLDERQVAADAVLAWLEETGGFCDCGVDATSRAHWDASR